MNNPFPYEEEPWWQRAFAVGWCGVCRELRRAGITKEAAERIATQTLALAKRELMESNGEMTVSMFTRRLIELTRSYVAKPAKPADPRNTPFEVSVAWRARYHSAPDES